MKGMEGSFDRLAVSKFKSFRKKKISFLKKYSDKRNNIDFLSLKILFFKQYLKERNIVLKC